MSNKQDQDQDLDLDLDQGRDPDPDPGLDLKQDHQGNKGLEEDPERGPDFQGHQEEEGRHQLIVIDNHREQAYSFTRAIFETNRRVDHIDQAIEDSNADDKPTFAEPTKHNARPKSYGQSTTYPIIGVDKAAYDCSYVGSVDAPAAAATNQRAVTITVASIISAAGVLFIIAGFLLYRRYKQRRPPFFHRGITPIDDEEIESWKISREIRDEEKSGGAFEKETGLEASGANGNGTQGHTRGAESTSSLKKVPSAVIVYQSTPAQQSQPFASGAGRQSEEFSPRSIHSPLRISKYGAYGSGGRVSIDRDYPQTPIQARAPNAREGLTDESVPGDVPYLPQTRRHPSRISKLPGPLSSSSRSMHNRSRSSRSSLRSFGERYSHDQPSPYGGGHTSSEQDLSPRWARASSDLPRGGALQQTQSLQHKLRHSKSSTGHHAHARGHNRVYSNSETPPRVSFSDDFLNSPRPLLLREDIGRAIG
ncbi:hypothetical protein M0657_001489 [Pyricularia oryzae]|nr:hypothetical protein M0657_001489 [Pyricularia oryzae]